MILFTILAIAVVVFSIIAIITAIIAGAGVVAIFGDAIVCVVFIWIIVRQIIKIRKIRRGR